MIPQIEVLRNPLRGDAPPRPHSKWTPNQFHRHLPGYEVTPLIDLPVLATRFGVRQVLVKDEASRLGLPAFKMLGASWASYRALDQLLETRTGAAMFHFDSLGEMVAQLEPLRPLDLATATDGNHGRAVARFARLVGLGARIFVPAGTSDARIDAIRSEGASCTVVDGTYEDAVARAASEAADDCLVISDTSWPGYDTVPRWVIEGYETIFHEILHESLDAGFPEPTVVLVPIGVGALAAAVVAHYRNNTWSIEHQSRPPLLIGVEPDTANCVMASAAAGHLVEVPGPHRSVMAGLNCGQASPVAWPWVSTGFDWFVAGGDDLATTGMRLLADQGVVSGESGACTVGALVALAAGAGRAAGLDAGTRRRRPRAVHRGRHRSRLLRGHRGSTARGSGRPPPPRTAPDRGAPMHDPVDRQIRDRAIAAARGDGPFDLLIDRRHGGGRRAPASSARPTSGWSVHSSPACTHRARRTDALDGCRRHRPVRRARASSTCTSTSRARCSRRAATPRRSAPGHDHVFCDPHELANVCGVDGVRYRSRPAGACPCASSCRRRRACRRSPASSCRAPTCTAPR